MLIIFKKIQQMFKTVNIQFNFFTYISVKNVVVIKENVKIR